MTLLDAESAEQSGELWRAAVLYEDQLGGAASNRTLLNLAVLYWQCTDPGVAAGMGLSADQMDHASRRTSELLDEVIRLYPGDTEARFWTRYIRWADLGDPFTLEEAERFARTDSSSLIPWMAVLSFSRGERGVPEAQALLRQLAGDRSTLAGYARSVVESVLESRRRAPG